MALIDKLSKMWSVDDSNRLPNHVDLIAIVSIGTTNDGVTNGVIATAKRAIELRRRYCAPIVYGAFAGNGNSIEEESKSAIFGDAGVYAGKVMTTIDECLAFKAKFPRAKKVIFVTEEAHSRRAKIVWRCLWKEAEIYTISVPLSKAVDDRSMMTTYHNPWKALILQAGPTPVYKFLAMLGPKALMLTKDLHQPIA